MGGQDRQRPMLEVKSLNGGYGSLNVLREVSIEVHSGELVCIVGANGAGKSTLLKCIQGLIAPTSGSIAFDNEEISGLAAEKIVRRGLSLVPEGRDLFPSLTVVDNLLLGAYIHRRKPDASQKRHQSMDQVFDLFPALEERRHAKAGNLSGGQQQMLAIGRALMAQPSALMLDEPSLGIAPLLVRQIFDAIGRLRETGMAILLVEQNVRAALRLAERAYVLETGAVVLSGASADLLKDDAVLESYLGHKKK